MILRKRLFQKSRYYCPWKKLCRLVFIATTTAIALVIVFCILVRQKNNVTTKAKQTEILGRRRPSEGSHHTGQGIHLPLTEEYKVSR